MRTRYALLATLTLAALAACGDNAVAPDARRASASVQGSAPPVTLDQQIRTTIAAIFDKGQATAVGARWESVERSLPATGTPLAGSSASASADVNKARAKLLSLVSYMQGKTDKVNPPAGETVDHAVARLTLLMSLYVFSGPTATPPVIAPSSDAVLAVVTPSATATTTIQTPTLHAGVRFPPGSLDETRIVVISQETTAYPENCSGPLETDLCQYPQFYKFNVFPDTKLLTPAIAAVCHINSGSARAPLADHDRFRIAHDAPENPADRVDGGTIEDGIEILPLVQAFGLTSCQGNSYQLGALPVAPRGALGRAVRWMTEPLARVASALADHLAPREAWAIDGIGGGRVSVFSDFGVIDPLGLPDLAVPNAPSMLLMPGPNSDSLEVGAWTVRNDGTATATDVVAQVVVAHDSMLTTGIVAAVTLGQVASMSPRDSLSGAGLTVNVPADTLGGPYYVGIRVSQNGEGGLSEASLGNNVVSVRVETRPPALGSWVERTSMLAARANAPSAVIGQQIYVVGGTTPQAVLSSTEVYDVGSNEWANSVQLPVARWGAAAVGINGRLLVAGGGIVNSETRSFDYVQSALMFDPVENVWSNIAPMSVGRAAPAFGVINGRFYVAGGFTSSGASTALEAYDPDTDRWTTLAPMPTRRFQAGAAVANGLLYVAGGNGHDTTATPTAAFEAYDPATNSWSEMSPLPTPRADLCLASIDGIIYAVGGFEYGVNYVVSSRVDAYDPSTNRWTSRAPLPIAMDAGACSVVGRTLYAIGGGQGGRIAPGVYAFTP